jgi:exodeoxyribonuclease VII small subunit
MADRKVTPEDLKQMSIEQIFAQIRVILAEIGSEDTPLEDAFDQYAAGMTLVKEAESRIDHVEKEIQVLADDGSFEPFSDDDSPEPFSDDVPFSDEGGENG